MRYRLFLLIFSFSLFLIFSGTSALAAGLTSPSSSTPTKTIEYSFVYPGILPDHPLYVFKTMRDRIVDFFTTDPEKRVEFLLLMADKRLIMGQTLADSGNMSLAHSTISKGEKYFLRATEEAIALKSVNKEMSERLLDKLTDAYAKHQELIEIIDRKGEWGDVQQTMKNIGKNLQ